MSDNNVPSAPDYSPMISAFNSLAAGANAHASEAMAWGKDQVANNKGLIDQINTGLIDTQKSFGEYGKDALAAGRGAIKSGTDYLTGVRDRYNDPTRKAADMGAAEANVGQAFDAARHAATSELESYGVNPGATRFGALDIGVRTQEAAAKAGAGNIASRQDEAMADNANTQILGQGNTNVANANALTSSGNAAGVGAVNNNLANTASGANVMGTGLQWTGAQTSALGGGVSAQNTGFDNRATQAKLNQSSSSGLGSLLGAGAGMLGKGGALASGGALSGLGTAAMAFLEDGGEIPQGPPGGAIPVGASPSNGAITDDVRATGPSGELRLNGGEFVIPKDAVSWLGEKTLQKLILKAREEKQGAGAKPAVGGGPDPASPAFQARPQPQGARPAVG